MLFMTNGAKADAWDKKTVITFSQAVELPGVVLPAGTYVFKLVDLPGVRNVVRVMNPDEDKVYATILAITDIHLTPHDETYLGFGERGAGSPQAIREWFYPGNTFGLEFVYPKVRAQELARETGTPVLAAEVKPAEALAELKAEPVVEETPENEEIAFSVAPQTPPLVGLPETRSTPAPILPETASPIPLIALAGLLCFAGATAIKASSR
jgi:hypothetical protein